MGRESPVLRGKKTKQKQNTQEKGVFPWKDLAPCSPRTLLTSGEKIFIAWESTVS